MIFFRYGCGCELVNNYLVLCKVHEDTLSTKGSVYVGTRQTIITR